jgi:hypothetical protein
MHDPPVYHNVVDCGHQYVVHINYDLSCGYDVRKLRVHHSLENGEGIP